MFMYSSIIFLVSSANGCKFSVEKLYFVVLVKVSLLSHFFACFGTSFSSNPYSNLVCNGFPNY